jgi:hypothetical protein
MTKTLNELIKEAEEKFFNELADKLDEFFPKHKCQERGKALVFNAFANILFKNQIRRIVKQSLEAVEVRRLNARDIFYGKGEVERGFEQSFNKAITQRQEKIKQFMGGTDE